jgi:hypothetical protein
MDIGSITWEGLKSPEVLAALVFLIVLLLAKPLLDLLYRVWWEWRHPGEPLPAEAPLRDLLVNAMALAIAIAFAWLRMAPNDRNTWGETLIVGIVAWGIATAGYEAVKNGAQTVGLNLGQLVKRMWGAVGAVVGLPSARNGPIE